MTGLLSADREHLPTWAAERLSDLLGRAPADPDMSQQQTLVLRHAAGGLINAEIAQVMVLSEDTVKSHMRAVFTRLGVRSRTGAFVVGLARGVIRPGDVVPAGRIAPSLSATQALVLLLLACGLSLQEVADVADMSLDTVKSHLRVILRRFGTRWSSHAVATGISLGLVPVPGLTLPAPTAARAS